MWLIVNTNRYPQTSPAPPQCAFVSAVEVQADPVVNQAVVLDIVDTEVSREVSVEETSQPAIADADADNASSSRFMAETPSKSTYIGRFEDHAHSVIIPAINETLMEIANELASPTSNIVDVSMLNSATLFPSLQLSNQLFQVIDSMQQQMVIDGYSEQQIRLIVGTITITLSVGYLGWIIKGAYLMSGVFTARRLSSSFDPIAPISRHSASGRYDDDGNDDDAVDSLFEPDRRVSGSPVPA